jgi:hypothetical protein
MRDECHRPIIDAGPGLNFFSINKERLLISVLAKLSAPEAVAEAGDDEGRDADVGQGDLAYRKPDDLRSFHLSGRHRRSFRATEPKGAK